MVNWQELDARWQQKWREAKLFEANPDDRPKFYLTVAYPYVSGPMHIGHGRTYTVPDVIARYKRMRGFNVLFPMAYHFTGTPIVGAAKRVERRDPQFVKVLTERYGVPPERLKEFENPHRFATYFAKESDLSYRKGMEWLGYSIDWRREFTTVDPHYQRFITWQYHKLWDAGLIVKGRHPVKWCPRCGNPVTDHDLLEGEGVEILEFTLLKYRLGDLVLPAATLRPETVFGVTNLWLNPEANYVVAEVNGEQWVVSEQAVEKLKLQGYEVGKVEPFNIDFSQEVEVPFTHKRVPILPASFVDPDNATGVVGSVPSHAPYDHIALVEIQRDPERLKAFGIDPALVEQLEPISLIETPGYGEHPAIDVVNRMGITDQRDPKLEEATAEVYRNEFAKGRMRDWVPKYGGMPVSEAKQAVRNDMLANREAAIMYEFSAKPVVCRCNSQVVVKVVEDQWFLNYADPDWKRKARECLARMHLVPPETRAQFEHTIEWLREWPCTRQIGMGTPAPWAEGWIIESLSDSTIYMAYYTVAHLLKQVDPEQLSDEVFDFVFHSRGDPENLARRTGISADLLRKMRAEFEYWYPLDYRMSANELIPNHLTFHIFHHAQLFPDRCPRGIVSFGMAILEGQKMSSSKGNIIAINEAVRRYGADTVRMYLLSVSEPWQDMDWKTREVEAMQRNLERFYQLATDLIKVNKTGRSLGLPERWLLSRTQRHVEAVTQALENFETRKAIQHAFFMMMQDVRSYLSCVGQNPSGDVLKKVLDTWLRMLSPFIPHTCEELWSEFGRKDFISTAKWPEADAALRDPMVELAWDYAESVVSDILDIKKVLKTKPSRAIAYVAEEWKWRAYQIAISHFKSGRIDFGELLKEIEAKVSPPCQKGDLARILQRILELLRRSSPSALEILKQQKLDEHAVLTELERYVSARTGLEFRVFRAEDQERYDPKNRGRLSLPMKPSLYLE